ncbi:MAG: hypothetical protein COS72_01215 [Candidatus Moranbacteria bacterium CG06_land_8_20_14_3_00_43_56]|nr:MAG: hypothetical protein COS72_01215 [Candidatus Moranbacteria bacterium CG06_land_8_20_14_3_00_43_56]
MKSPENQNFHTAEQKTEAEKAPEFSFRNFWQKFADYFCLKKQSGQEILKELEKRKGDTEQQDLLSESEEVYELHNVQMRGVESEAKLEVASLTGEAHEVIEQIPPSQLKKFVWYNLSTTPEGFMKEAERERLERLLDLSHIEENPQGWRKYLSDKIKTNDVVCLGEAHTAEIAEKTAVTEFLEQAKENGITEVGLEIEERLQGYFDRYLETGKFQESDNPEDYEKVAEYQRLRHEWHRTHEIESLKAMSAFEKTMEGNFVFSGYFYEHYPLLKRARELGLRIRCIDANQKHSQEEIDQALDAGTFTEWKQQKEAERDQRMFENIRGVVSGGKGKMLVLLGAAHLARGELRHKNLGDLLLEDSSIKSSRVNLDRNFDEDITMQETKEKLGADIKFNSILYTALEKRGVGQVGFDLDNSVLQAGNGKRENFPFDGYVKI